MHLCSVCNIRTTNAVDGDHNDDNNDDNVNDSSLMCPNNDQVNVRFRVPYLYHTSSTM